MQTATTLEMLRSRIADLRLRSSSGGATIALVPTMGALHEGHLTLIREAKARADHVVASIFVNPLQFGPNEDLDAYPRQLAHDSALLEAESVALLWAPSPNEVYPAGFGTTVSVAGVGEGLCGVDRPGHFDGVATVVCKLFNQVRPDMAFFGEKDWQQLSVIRRMARDLDLTHPHATAIHAVGIVREADGLAMSSRNAYLSPDNRERAAALPRAMAAAVDAIRSGDDTARTLAGLTDALRAAGFAVVDYAELRDADSLAPLDAPNGNARLFVAARIGGTRLIDNIPL